MLPTREQTSAQGRGTQASYRFGHILIAIRIDAGLDAKFATLKVDMLPTERVKFARVDAGRGGKHEFNAKCIVGQLTVSTSIEP